MFVVSDLPRNGWWPVYEQQDGYRLRTVTMGRTEYEAFRIAELLTLHGLEPCTTEDLAAALLDLEGRTDK